MTELEARTSLYVALISAILIRLDMVNASQARCRPDYRNLPSGVIHTACKGPNPRCSLARELTGLSDQAKLQVLQAHNDYRSQVAKGQLPNFPPAKYMYELEWDDEMAEVAQAFADQCDYSANDLPEARTTSRFKSVGQCLGWAVDTALQNGHRLQDVIWAETRYVGCGFSNFQHGRRYARIFVCNYAPAGSHDRKPIYLPGQTCSECPAWTTCNPATGLCGSGGASEPGGRPVRPQAGPVQTGVGGSAAGAVVGTVGAAGVGDRIGQKGYAIDGETSDDGFTLLAAIAMFVAFLLGLLVGACLVTLCRQNRPKNTNAAAVASQNSGNMGMSSMSTMNY
ncbi:hypothetical protein MTO96_014929 [Rhipicephalus appendiculatus]